MNGIEAWQCLDGCFLAVLKCSLICFVGQRIAPRTLPLVVKPASQEHRPAGRSLRDALKDLELRDKAIEFTRLLGKMVCGIDDFLSVIWIV